MTYALRWIWKDGSAFQTPFLYQSRAGAEKAKKRALGGGHLHSVKIISGKKKKR